MKNKFLFVLIGLIVVAATVTGLIQVKMALATTATTSLTITKYAGDGTTVLAQVTVSVNDLKTCQAQGSDGQLHSCPVQGDGTTHYYTQGPTFVSNNLWDPDETLNLKDKGALEGTALSDLCNLVGGANPGDLVQVGAADGYGNDRFPYANVYNQLATQDLNNRQGKMVICWYNGDPEDGNPGYVPDYSNGMLLAFFAQTTNAAGQYVFGHQDMHDCLPQTDWHWYYDSGIQYPSTNGMYVKWVSDIKIYTGSTADWTIGLYGARSDTLTQTWFEDGIADNCHGVTTYTDGQGNIWSGLPLWRVCGIVDDLSNIHGPGSFNTLLYYDVKVTGIDGSYYVFPSTTIANNNDYILANKLNGSALPSDKYPLKLVSKNFTVGGPSIAQIARIDLLNISTTPPNSTSTPSGAADWPLILKGVGTETMSKDAFTQGVTCHGAATWTDDDGNVWSGLPLWMLVARVDDSNTHGSGCFNDTLAATNYQIKVIAADGYYQYFYSSTIAHNSGYIVANQVKLADTSDFIDLPETMTGGTPPSQHPAYPLKIVGSATSSGDRVGSVVEIDLQLNSTPATTPTTTPTPTTTTPATTWDLNSDHTCDIGDVVVLGLHWGQTGAHGWIPEDLNNDGIIDIADVVALGLHWGQTW